MEPFDKKMNIDPMMLERVKSFNGSVEAVENYVGSLRLKIADKTIENELPYKSNMWDVHRVLERWGISSTAYKLTSEDLAFLSFDI